MNIIDTLYFDNLRYNEIISFNKAQQNSSQPGLKIGILRNITVDSYLPLIKYVLFKQGFSADVKQGEYDVIMQEVLDTHSSMNQFNADILIIFLNIRQIGTNVWSNYPELTAEEISAEKEYILEYVEKLFEALNKNSRSKIIFNLFELPVSPAHDIAEIQTQKGQRALVDDWNKRINEISKRFRDIYFTDLNIVKEKLGTDAYYDNRYWYMGKAPYTIEAMKAIAVEHLKIINSLYGKTKKCLVLDCDNTLWGGIIGEDGIKNIKIGKTYPGNMFLDFQRKILNLRNKGVILAICSKNNESDVLDVLENHPDMLLRKEHFSCMYVNWNNKAENIKNISLDLNIGLDSMVFIDDSEFECNLVKEQLGSVTVIQLPKEASRYPRIIEDCGFFDKLNYTNEDKKRGELYRVEVERDKYKTSFSDLFSYYKSLEMKIEIEAVDEFSSSRASQLTQRTNQFNLTTKRYSKDDIAHFMSSPDYEVSLLKLSDKFGDMGIVGLSIIDFTNKDKAVIDSFMMSCRIIGRGVENIFLRNAVDTCFGKNFQTIQGMYIKTSKNGLAADFYKNNGFEGVSENGNSQVYQLNDIQQLPPVTNYFKEITIK